MKARTAVIMNTKQRMHIPFEHFPFYWPLETPFYWASFTRPFEAREVLLNLGADIDDLDSDGDGQAQTALRTAIYRADSTVVRYLLIKGADPQKTDGKGRNPFHMLALDYWYQNRLFPLPKGIQ